jgi:signal peptidase II
MSAGDAAVIDRLHRRKHWPTPLFWILVFGLISTDQAVKEWTERTLQVRDSIVVIPGVFHLTYVRNTGVAFGFLQGNNFLLGLLAMGLVGVGIWFARSLDWASREMNILAALLVSGAVGNLIDRFRHGYVVDMFDFHGIGYPWVFNVADSCICVTVLWLLWRQFVTATPTK